MSQPLVTVYITNHNYGRFLRESIESVLRQTMTDFELLVIDDGSTDDSARVLKAYENRPGVQVIYQQRKGLNHTNNIALRVARGTYLMRLDADDYLDRNALLVMSNMLEKDPALGLVFPDYYLVDVHGHVLGMERRHAFDKEVSLLDMPAHGACTMIRRSCLQAVGGYDEGYSCQDGYELWIKFTSRYRVANVNLPLFYYRQHGGNLTRNERKILSTRAAMKRSFVRRHKRAPRAVAVVSVRGRSVDPGCVALLELGGKRVVDWVIDAALGAAALRKVIVTSSDADVAAHVRRRYRGRGRCVFVPRPPELARLNRTVQSTLRHVLAVPAVRRLRPEVVLVLATNCPFLSSTSIDEAAHTFGIFPIDSLVGVRPETAVMYQHDGHGLHVILNQDKFTHLEREALFRHAGGLSAYRVALVERSDFEHRKSVGHVVVDQRAAHAIRSDYDLEVARHLAALA